jgi:4-hydroxybenzoate polyprenyltransferase
MAHALRLFGAALAPHTAASRTLARSSTSLRHGCLGASALASRSRRRLPLSPLSSPAALRRSFSTTSPQLLHASPPHRASASSTPPPSTSLLSRLAPYAALARLSRPIGTWLLFWPSAFSLALGGHHLGLPPSVALGYTALFGVGAVVMRGAGCTVNDLWDRELDKKVGEC